MSAPRTDTTIRREGGPGMPRDRAGDHGAERHLTLVPRELPRDANGETDLYDELLEIERQAAAGALGPSAQAEMALRGFTRAAFDQRQRALDYLAQIRGRDNLRFPFLELDRIVGPLLYGWLVFIGARPKAGKTSMLLHLFEAWTSLRRRCLYLGTETGEEALRLQWACLRKCVALAAYLEGDVTLEEAAAIEQDLRAQVEDPRLADYALFKDVGQASIAELEATLEQAALAGVKVVLVDYLQRLEGHPGQKDYERVSENSRRLKNAAKRLDLLVVAAGQLSLPQGGGLLGEFEVPGNASWYMGSRPQQEGDVCLQQWRPFKKGVTAQLKGKVKAGTVPVANVVQQGVMAIRCSAHRWRPDAINAMTKLQVEAGRIEDFPTWGMPRDEAVAEDES